MGRTNRVNLQETIRSLSTAGRNRSTAEHRFRNVAWLNHRCLECHASSWRSLARVAEIRRAFQRVEAVACCSTYVYEASQMAMRHPTRSPMRLDGLYGLCRVLCLFFSMPCTPEHIVSILYLLIIIQFLHERLLRHDLIFNFSVLRIVSTRKLRHSEIMSRKNSATSI